MSVNDRQRLELVKTILEILPFIQINEWDDELLSFLVSWARMEAYGDSRYDWPLNAVQSRTGIVQLMLSTAEQSMSVETLETFEAQ